MSTVVSEAAFSISGRLISKKRCNLSPEAIEITVCLKYWNLVDKRLHDHVRKAALMTDIENLNLSSMNQRTFMQVSRNEEKIICEADIGCCCLWIKTTSFEGTEKNLKREKIPNSSRVFVR